MPVARKPPIWRLSPAKYGSSSYRQGRILSTTIAYGSKIAPNISIRRPMIVHGVISDVGSRGGVQHYTRDRLRRAGNPRRILEEPECANVSPHPPCTQACFAPCPPKKRRSLFLWK